jgi:hypothetical protein
MGRSLILLDRVLHERASTHARKKHEYHPILCGKILRLDETGEEKERRFLGGRNLFDL